LTFPSTSYSFFLFSHLFFLFLLMISLEHIYTLSQCPSQSPAFDFVPFQTSPLYPHLFFIVISQSESCSIRAVRISREPSFLFPVSTVCPCRIRQGQCSIRFLEVRSCLSLTCLFSFFAYLNPILEFYSSSNLLQMLTPFSYPVFILFLLFLYPSSTLLPIYVIIFFRQLVPPFKSCFSPPPNFGTHISLYTSLRWMHRSFFSSSRFSFNNQAPRSLRPPPYLNHPARYPS